MIFIGLVLVAIALGMFMILIELAELNDNFSDYIETVDQALNEEDD